MNMPKKKSSVVAGKAWNLLRLSLLWARKVGAFKRGIKAKGFGGKARTHQIHYMERQLSFDRTPDSPVKKDHLTGSMLSLFPCVGAKAVEFDYDIAADEDGGFYGNHNGRESFLTEEEEEEEEEEDECNGCEKKSQSEEEGIDSRAEKFIAEFYGQTRFRS